MFKASQRTRRIYVDCRSAVNEDHSGEARLPHRLETSAWMRRDGMEVAGRDLVLQGPAGHTQDEPGGIPGRRLVLTTGLGTWSVEWADRRSRTIPAKHRSAQPSAGA
nr:hypothetical protein CFP56_03309 [Quercus suber]